VGIALLEADKLDVLVGGGADDFSQIHSGLLWGGGRTSARQAE
jgi:hypothetical protein